MATTPGIGDIVRVQNLGAKPIKCMWDSRHYNVPVGGEEFMPFECMKLYFGDPRAAENIHSVRDDRGVVGFVSDRATEVRRLRLLWDHKFGEYIPGEVDAFDDTRIPHVHVFDIRGNPVPTVLDDPEGTRVMQAHQTQAQQTDLMSVVQNQGKMIEILMQRLGMDQGPATFNGMNLPPVDSPPDPTPVPEMVFDPKQDKVIKRPAEVAVEDADELDELPEVEE